jgi:hypothetical protein
MRLAEKSGRAASAALPHQRRGRSARPHAAIAAHDRLTPNLTCDFCGSPRTRDERNRFVWENTLAPGLVLAELCPRCAGQAHPLLELHGGRARNIKLVRESRVATPTRTRTRTRTAELRALGSAARGTLYLLIALASFLLMTMLTSRGR